MTQFEWISFLGSIDNYNKPIVFYHISRSCLILCLARGHRSSVGWNSWEAPVLQSKSWDLSAQTVQVMMRKGWNTHHVRLWFRFTFAPVHQRWNFREPCGKYKTKKLYLGGSGIGGETERRMWLEDRLRHPSVLEGKRVSDIPDNWLATDLNTNYFQILIKFLNFS